MFIPPLHTGLKYPSFNCLLIFYFFFKIPFENHYFCDVLSKDLRENQLLLPPCSISSCIHNYLSPYNIAIIIICLSQYFISVFWNFEYSFISVYSFIYSLLIECSLMNFLKFVKNVMITNH